MLWGVASDNGWEIDIDEVTQITSQARTLSGLITFLLGLFVTLTLNRWWLMRTSLTTVHSNLTNLAVALSGVIDPEFHDRDAVTEFKEDVIRLIQVVHLSIFIEANHVNNCPESCDIPDKLFDKLADQLNEKEKEVLNKTNGTRMARTALAWLQQRVNKAEQDTLIVGSESVPLWYTAQYILAAAVWM